MSNGKIAAMERILLATDFSRWTQDAMDFALELAKQFEAELLLVHAIEPVADGAVDEEEEDGSFDEFFGDLMAKSQSALEALISRAANEGVAARSHIEIGQRWRIIVRLAETEEADLIVLGRRTYREQRDLALGTTSQRVYFSTNLPVLTVPASPVQEE